MNIAQLSEQLKDVPQNRLVDYAKNPNSVVPQFLALAEIQRRQHLQAQAQPPAQTVAEDVLAQAAPQQMPPQLAPQMAPQQMAQQLPENQPGVAQLPSGMPQGMASGGIVAFAGGDLVDDEEEYDAEEKQANREESRIRNLIAGMRARVGNAVADVPRAVSAAVPTAIAAIPRAVESASSGIKSFASNLPKSYETVKAEAALKPQTQEGDIEGFLSKIQHLESRGRHFDAQGNILTSPKGAEGIMQVMRKTQKDPGYGVTPARDRSPEELERVGKEYGIAMLKEFGDPKLAAMAYNWGPGNVKKWLASDRKTPIPKETQKYASHFSQGGIASFAGLYGSTVKDSYSDHPNWLLSNAGITSVNPYEAPSPVSPSVPQPSVNYDFDNMDIGFGAGKYSPEADLEQAGPKRPSYYEEAVARINQDREDLKAQAGQDKYLAMLQAGLGMMSGTSPYAMANIGQGGMQGVAAYSAAKKQRALERLALGKEELSVRRLEQLSDSEKAALAATAGYKQEETQRKLGAETRRIEEKYVDDYNSFIQNITKRAAQSIPTKDINGLPIDPEERIRLIQQEEARLFKQNEKILKNLAERAKIPMPDFSEPPPRMTAPVKKDEPGFFSKLFGGNKPSSGAVDTRNPLLQ